MIYVFEQNLNIIVKWRFSVLQKRKTHNINEPQVPKVMLLTLEEARLREWGACVDSTGLALLCNNVLAWHKIFF